MLSLVNRKFAEWTRGLDTRESMISVFSHIRDIPYSLTASVTDPKTATEQILRLGKGSCAPKHYLLAEMYRKLNLNVIYATIAFMWNDRDIHYPPRLRELATRLPVSHHLACRVQIGSRWVLVDATWDPPLAAAGFPVNGHWDGYSDTICAVKPIRSPVRTAYCRTLENVPCRCGDEKDLDAFDGEKDHRVVEDRARYYDEMVAVRTPEEVARIREFSYGFDEWLERLRQSGSD